MAADELDELDWVVWNLEVRDPGELTAPDVGARTVAAMTELAGSLGCVFDQCCDDNAVDGVPYYAWLVRVPRAEHRRRDGHGVPVVIGALHAYLRTQLPDRVDDWRIGPDRQLSRRDPAGRILGAVYDDLLDPLEGQLLGLRRDGAQALDPQAQCWWSGDGDRLAGTYALWLCQDPDTAAIEGSGRWLVVYAGLAVADGFWTGEPGQGLRRFGVEPDSPVLVLPRPPACLWLVTVTTGSFRIPPGALRPLAVGASYRWTSRDGAALAHRVGADLRALLR